PCALRHNPDRVIPAALIVSMTWKSAPISTIPSLRVTPTAPLVVAPKLELASLEDPGNSCSHPAPFRIDAEHDPSSDPTFPPASASQSTPVPVSPEHPTFALTPATPNAAPSNVAMSSEALPLVSLWSAKTVWVTDPPPPNMCALPDTTAAFTWNPTPFHPRPNVPDTSLHVSIGGQSPNGSVNVTGSPPANPYRFSPPPIPIGSCCVNRPLAGSKNRFLLYSSPASPLPFAGKLPIHTGVIPAYGSVLRLK